MLLGYVPSFSFGALPASLLCRAYRWVAATMACSSLVKGRKGMVAVTRELKGAWGGRAANI
jgi:hypothetical protein